MIFPKYRLQAADAGADAGSAATLMTDGANPTPAASSTAPATAEGVTPVADAGATSQAPEATAQAEAEATAPKPEKVVPDKYEFKTPDGTTLDADATGELEGIAKELGLSQDEAQKVADIGAKMAQKWETKQADAAQAASAEWAAAATSDKEYGGDKLTESLTTAKRALDAFGTPELRSLLEGSRLGNHPEVIRFMVRAGKAISEDRMVTGGAGPATSSQSTAKSLYPNQS